MSPSASPLNHCPGPLLKVMSAVLSAQDQPLITDGIHEKSLELTGTEYDQLTVFFYNTFGSPFSWHNAQDGTEYTLSFVEKPVVAQEPLIDQSRHYTVLVKLMKLPTVPG